MDVKLPNLGEGADSGTVVNLFVKEGDQIAKDQPILELENEKAVATIPSTAAGRDHQSLRQGGRQDQRRPAASFRLRESGGGSAADCPPEAPAATVQSPSPEPRQAPLPPEQPAAEAPR